MNKKSFLNLIEEHVGSNLEIEIEGIIIQKVTLKNYKYEVKDDKLILVSNSNSNTIIINLNIIRQIKEDEKKILIYLEDNAETIIKISVI